MEKHDKSMNTKKHNEDSSSSSTPIVARLDKKCAALQKCPCEMSDSSREGLLLHGHNEDIASFGRGVGG